MNTVMNKNEFTGMDWVDKEVSTGTTIIAVEFDGGVVIGADSRTTQGAYIANRVTDKINRLTDHIFICRSGSAADTKAIAEIVGYRLDLLGMELGEPVSVRTAANDIRQIVYSYRESLEAGLIVGGWDRKLGGQVYCVTLGGMINHQKYCIGGSGSGYIYGFMDENYKPGMKKEQCVNLVLEALCLAMWRDGSSGGVARVGIITEKGIERKLFTGDEVKKFYPH